MASQPKSKKTSRDRGAVQKAEKKNQQRAGGVFFCEKTLDLMMEIWSSILGNRPPLQRQQRVSRRRLLCACQWGVLDGFAHRTRRMGKCFSKFNRWFKRGVRSELFEQLSRR